MTVEGTEAAAEGAVIDAAADAAKTAELAAKEALAASAAAAANSQVVAAERTEQLEEKVASEIVEQKDELAWLKTHATETQATLQNQSSVLTAIAERQATHEAALKAIVERLTPPASPEPDAKTPEQIAAENSEATKAEAEARAKEKAQRRNRWI